MKARGGRPNLRRVNGLYGGAALLALALFAFVSYRTTTGTGFKTPFKIGVEVRDAQGINTSSDVRVAGARVGRVSEVTAMPATHSAPPHTHLVLALDRDVAPIPADTTVKLRPVSVLGASYVDLILGRGEQTVTEGADLKGPPVTATVQITDLLDVFAPPTGHQFQRAITPLGDGLAGRGESINDTLAHLSSLAAPVARVAALLADPGTRLANLLQESERFTINLEPHGPQLARLIDDGATTMEALSAVRPQLGRTLDLLAPTARTTTKALTDLRPALDDLAAISSSLRKPADRLPVVLGHVARLTDRGTKPLAPLPALLSRAAVTLRRLRGLLRQPQLSSLLRRSDDMVAAGRYALSVIEPAQLHCNVFGQFVTNFSTLAAVPRIGPIGANLAIANNGAQNESTQAGTPSPNLKTNPAPNESWDECEAGSEPRADTSRQVLGNPEGLQNPPSVHWTRTPPLTLQRARQAGLIDPPKVRP